MSLYRRAVRPALFKVDPERAHEGAVWTAERIAAVARTAPWVPAAPSELAREVMGLRFPNPVGLAAGFDKSARAVAAWGALGFGFAEIGTVTARPQPGNERPRIFRLPEDRALINRLGFNNDGAAEVAGRLAAARRRRRRIPIGVNIGKSKVVPAEEAPDDYAACLDRLWPYADYVVVNVSSPNTPGLRDLQATRALGDIMRRLLDLDAEKARTASGGPRPMLVKLAPDLPDEEVDDIVDLALDIGLDGLVVSNTTLAREGLSAAAAGQAGGLSGRPLAARSSELVARVSDRAGDQLDIIGVGGIFTAADVREKLDAGASLVQLYTGLIYEGPGLVRSIVSELAAPSAAGS